LFLGVLPKADATDATYTPCLFLIMAFSVT